MNYCQYVLMELTVIRCSIFMLYKWQSGIDTILTSDYNFWLLRKCTGLSQVSVQCVQRCCRMPALHWSPWRRNGATTQAEEQSIPRNSTNKLRFFQPWIKLCLANTISYSPIYVIYMADAVDTVFGQTRHGSE